MWSPSLLAKLRENTFSILSLGAALLFPMARQVKHPDELWWHLGCGLGFIVAYLLPSQWFTPKVAIYGTCVWLVLELLFNSGHQGFDEEWFNYSVWYLAKFGTSCLNPAICLDCQ